MSYKLKYEKYKSKYLKLKYYMKGGEGDQKDGEGEEEGHEHIGHASTEGNDEQIGHASTDGDGEQKEGEGEGEHKEGEGEGEHKEGEGEEKEGGQKEHAPTEGNSEHKEDGEVVVEHQDAAPKEIYIYHLTNLLYIDKIKKDGLTGRDDKNLFAFIDLLSPIISNELLTKKGLTLSEEIKEYINKRGVPPDTNLFFTENATAHNSGIASCLGVEPALFLDTLKQYANLPEKNIDPEKFGKLKDLMKVALEEEKINYSDSIFDDYDSCISLVENMLDVLCVKYTSIIIAIKLDDNLEKTGNGYNMTSIIKPEDLYIKTDTESHLNLLSTEASTYINGLLKPI